MSEEDRGRAGPVAQEGRDFVRAFSGAFLFGIPLLFTMEMWWLGSSAGIWRLLLILAIALVANAGLAVAGGFKRRSTFANSLDQAVDAVAVGVVASLAVLLVLNRIGASDSLASILGKVVVQALPLSLGASVANIIFARGGRSDDDAAAARGAPESGRQSGSGGAAEAAGRSRGTPAGQTAPQGWRAVLNDLGATATGGVFLAASIAPTEEIPMLAAGLTFPHQLALVGLTLVISYAIVFASGFDPQQTHRGGAFQSPFTETTWAYLVALAVSLGAVYLFGQADAGDPLGKVLPQVIVLALPAAVGGAAGRLVV